MSLPSVSTILKEQGLVGVHPLTPRDAEEVLLEAMRRDVSLATDYLQAQAHTAQETGRPVLWKEDPSSPLGKQLIRVCASDAMRPLAETHYCHGLAVTFVNCCGGIVGQKKPPLSEVLDLQVSLQDGTIGAPDC